MPPSQEQQGAPRVQPTQGTFTGGLIRYPQPATEQQSPSTESHPLVIKLGLHQATTGEAWRAALIEMIGTAMFVFASIGVVASAGNQGNPPLYIGVMHAILLTLFIFATAAPSGGHLNPTITFATMCTGHTPPFRALIYVIAQIAGAVVGALLMKEVLPSAAEDAINLGACALGDNLSTSGALVNEVLFTMVLLFVAYGCAFDERQGAVFGPVMAPPLIGVILGTIIFITGSMIPGYTGAGMNFARCIGPEIAMGSLSKDLFMAGPAITCVLHGVLYAGAPPHHKIIFAPGNIKKPLVDSTRRNAETEMVPTTQPRV